MKDFLFFSGTSNLPLSQAVAVKLGVSLGNVEITRFMDNECRVFVKDDVAGKEAFVVQSLSEVADQHLVELCLLAAVLKDLKASHVTAIIPWLGYSKQDKAFRKGEAVSAQLVAKFIETAGFDRVVTIELHSQNVLPFFHIPIIELSTETLLAGALKTNNGVVVSPDKGGKSRSERFAKHVQLPIVYIDKSRDLTTGAVSVTGISGSVGNRDVIIYDDIINTGATAVKTSQFLRDRGAKKIFFLATHAVFAGDAVSQLSKSTIDQVIVTDTIAIPKQKMFDKLQIVSVAPLVADAISSIVR